MKKIRPRKPNKRRKEEGNPFFSEKESKANENTNSDGFFQAKLEIGDPSSPFEKEADAMADHVLNKDQEKASGDAFGKQSVQRQAEEEEPAAKRIQRQAEEEEPAAKRIQRQAEEEEPAAKQIQRKEEFSEKEEKKMEAGATMDSVDSMIQNTKGQGMPLPEEIKKELEAEMKADFTNVRIHTDEKAIELSAMLNAQAFTHGYDIYFNIGKYDPYSRTGKHLLVHELTHVVQQKG